MEYQDYLKLYESYKDARPFLKEPNKLYEPIDYILEIGGKRLRPVLLLSACDLFEGDLQRALPAAHAVEVFHNFTLMHDDIMDASDMRRGKESVPKKYGANLAILSGDTMLIKAYQEIEKMPKDSSFKAFQLFNKTALEVCEGQMMDMSFEETPDVKESDYLEMIRLKTAVLLACSLKLGGICSNVSETQLDLLYELGINMGMAFQIQDDILDSFGNENFGKEIGGDILNDKKTILFIHALQNTDSSEEELLLNSIGKKEKPEEKISLVKSLFEKYKSDEYARNLMNDYFTKANDTLQKIDCSESKKGFLESLNQLLIKRAV